ncbi:major facilitator superfamily transporter [Ceratobasidium sp. AG-Ba]|nr:major facilitator superfamily transporter [Ceratobasidium sp. AG-Ba]QRW04627.1 major facilitator superfamily transporter [Ceratobasidium sp. AG-Ba]
MHTASAEAVTSHAPHDNEHAPLLPRPLERKTPTPLPTQLFVILFLCLAEPITSSVIYPFITELVATLGVTNGDDRKVGYYAGIIESIFFLTETCLILQYGRLSDRIGRRPVVLLGLFGLALSITSFGLAKTFTGLVIARALSGALNGNAGVIKSIVCEITDETNRAQSFALLSVTWSVGSTIGPVIGGSLSHPAQHFPSVFAHPVWKSVPFPTVVGFWNEYPYFLPCFAAAGVAIAAWCVALMFLRESLPARRIHLVRKATAEYGSITWDAESPAPAPESVPCGLREVLTPQVGWAVGSFMLLAVVDIAWVVLQPLVFATSPSLGGLGLSPPTIGLILGTQGLLSGIFQATAFTSLHARFGAVHLFRVALACYAGLFVSFAVMTNAEGVWVWVVLGLHVVMACVASLGFSCTFIFVTSSAPSPALLGTTNGLAQTSCSLVRAFGPAGAASLFALSSGGGTMVYWVCVGVVTLAGCASLGLVE